MKRILFAIIMCIGLQPLALADFREHFEEGQQSLHQNQYSTAIIEFKKALRINYLDNSAKIGLINAYLARGAYYGTTAEDWEAATNDFRAALFYMKYYGNITNANNAASIISQATSNLEKCYDMQNFDRSPANRYQKAMELRQAGKFAEAGYEFFQAADSKGYKLDSYTQLADLFKLIGNEEASIPCFEKALQGTPNNSALRLKYARTLDRLNKEDEAVIQYNLALAQSDGDQEILYALERIYMKKMQKNPNDAEIYANLGAIKQKQQDFETALRYYAKADQIKPPNVQTRLNIGTLFQQQNDYIKALQSYNSILALYPDNLEANLYKAQALEAQGEKKQAFDCYQKVLNIDPSNKMAAAKISAMIQEGMTPQEMVAYLKNSVKKDPDMVNSVYNHAVSLHKENKTNEAIKYYREVIKYDTNNEEAYINLAICYAENADYDRAKQVLNIAKVRFPSNKQVLSTLASIETDATSDKLSNANKNYESGNYSEALESYLAITPATKDSLLGIAACYQGLKQPDNAINYYKQAEKLAPNDNQIKYYIGAIYTEKGDYKNAETYLKLVSKQVPQANELLNFINQKSSMDTLEAAIKDFEAADYTSSLTKIAQVLEKEPSNAYAYYYRGMVYDAQNKRANAISDYTKVIELAPEIVIANYLLAIDYDTLQKFPEAYKAYTDFVAKYNNEDEYKTYSKKRLEDLKPYATEN